jgi:hypothetical protein
MSESEVVALLTELNDNERYVPGYWKHEAFKFATDAYVFQELATVFEPKVSLNSILFTLIFLLKETVRLLST